MENRSVNINVEKEMHKALKQIALNKNTTVTSMLRPLIHQLIKENSSKEISDAKV